MAEAQATGTAPAAPVAGSPPAAPVAASPPGNPCVMVIFGASGDLTKRLLMPAIYNLACDGLLPDKFAIVGSAMDEWTTDQFRERMTADIKQFNTRNKFDQAVWDEAVQPPVLLARQIRRPGRLPSPVGHRQEARRRVPGRRQRPLLLRGPAVGLRPDLDQPGQGRFQGGCRRLAAYHRREAVRQRPQLGPQAQQGDPHLLGRKAGLPRRPLPRQGDGAEPARVPFLQRYVSSRCGTRTTSTTCKFNVTEVVDVEGRGGYYDSVGRAARHDAEPHVSDARLPLHGAAQFLWA